MTNIQVILIVDDDADIRNLLGKFLKQHGFQSFLASNGKEMHAILKQQTIDLIILDIMLPGEDGLSLCRQLRSKSNIPIVMLTAIGEEVDRIVGLEMGSDDYINKPFNPRELLARIKAVLRRAQNPNIEPVKINNLVYHFSGWNLDRCLRRLVSPE
jgi:two-component system OmpR family response regulator